MFVCSRVCVSACVNGVSGLLFTDGSDLEWTNCCTFLGGLLVQGPAGAPAGVIIEKTWLQMVSDGLSCPEMFGWNVFMLSYPTHGENVMQLQLLKHIEQPGKNGLNFSLSPDFDSFDIF